MLVDRSKIIFFILVFITLVIGILIGKIVTIPCSFAVSMDPLEGVSILCTVFVAVYVSSILESQKDSFKIKRDLALSRAKDLDEYVHEIAEFISISGQKYGEITFRLKKIFMMSERISKVLTLTKIKNQDFRNKFQNLHKELRVLMTNIPISISSSEEIPLVCTDGKVIYSRERLQEIEIKLDEVKDCVLKLQIEIVNN